MEEDINYVDGHVHLVKGLSFEDYIHGIKEPETGELVIKGAIVFPISNNIYQRYNKKFKDTDKWIEKRRKANSDVLELSKNEKRIKIFPFKSIWNDFNLEDLGKYYGVKWQRHSVDPQYEIGSKRFKELLSKLKERNMPIFFEDEFENIKKFVKTWAGDKINVIIPHLGYGNQCYDQLKKAKIWKRKNVYTDTSYVSDIHCDLIRKHIIEYGHDNIFFGSDFGAGCLASSPQQELEKINKMALDYEKKRAVTSENILRLLREVRR